MHLLWTLLYWNSKYFFRLTEYYLGAPFYVLLFKISRYTGHPSPCPGVMRSGRGGRNSPHPVPPLRAEWRSRYSDWLRAGRAGDRIPLGARFFVPVQAGPGAHPASCTMGAESFPGVKNCRGVTLTPHPLLVPWSRKSVAIPLLSLWALRPVQSLSACTRVNFTFTFTFTFSSPFPVPSGHVIG